MKNFSHTELTLIALLVLLYLGCEGFEEESFDYTELESSAVALMQDTLFIDFNLPLISDYDAGWNSGQAILASASEVIDSLSASSFLVIVQDNCYRITPDSENDSSYIALAIESSGSVALFFSETLTIDLFTKTGLAVSPDNSPLGMDVIATGIGYDYDAAGARTLEYYLKTSRYYDLDSGQYLLRMIVTDQTHSTTFRYVMKSGF